MVPSHTHEYTYKRIIEFFAIIKQNVIFKFSNQCWCGEFDEVAYLIQPAPDKTNFLETFQCSILTFYNSNGFLDKLTKRKMEAAILLYKFAIHVVHKITWKKVQAFKWKGLICGVLLCLGQIVYVYIEFKMTGEITNFEIYQIVKRFIWTRRDLTEKQHDSRLTVKLIYIPNVILISTVER